MDVNILEHYLPLGSIVILNGGVKKVMIIARGVITPEGDKKKVFDYGGICYPEGVVNDQIAFFNAKDIYKVVFEGYSDADDEVMNDNIKLWLGKVKKEQTIGYK